MAAPVPGRARECAQLARVLREVSEGHSRVLVVRGEAGVGKTRLLEHMVESARGFRVARVTGIQSEMELAFAGLNQLCEPMSTDAAALPEAQRAAVSTVMRESAVSTVMRESGETVPEGFLMALGVLGLLAEAARERPLLCVVDDAQWLDRASLQVLAFTARRLVAESVALVFAVRTTDGATTEPAEFVGLPTLAVEGLADEDARALLRTTVPGPWDERVLARIVVETRGNPLALRELPKTSSPLELAGGFGSAVPRPVDTRIRDAYLRRVHELPAWTRQLLLVAAAEPTGEPAMLWSAATRLGIPVTAAEAAIAADLLVIGDVVGFVHPIVRSVVYWSAEQDARRTVHRALAAATDPGADPDRRAWHAAHGAAGPDEAVAAELERSAARARTRGGSAAAAAFLTRAVDLTPDPDRRRARAVAAARVCHAAGDPGAAGMLLTLAEAGVRDDRLRIEIDLLRARIAFTTHRGRAAPLMLLAVARDISAHDPALAREIYLEVIDAAMFAGPRAFRRGHHEAALAARATDCPTAPRPVDLLLDAYATRILDGHPAAVPAFHTALTAFVESIGSSPDTEVRWLWLVAVSAAGVWDHAVLARLSVRNLELVRAAGQTSALPLALLLRTVVHVLDGELAEAATRVTEIRAVCEAVGVAHPPQAALVVAAWRGRESECLRLGRYAGDADMDRGEGIGPVVSGWASAVLYNSLARYAEAAEAARVATEEYVQLEFGIPTWTLVEYIEAAALSGRHDRAFEALVRLTEITRPCDTDWAAGIEARSHALISDGDDADALYREAITRLERAALRGEAARAHLLYGEWLRREGRDRTARDHLRTAHDAFTAMEMGGFAQRAAGELAAAGERVGPPVDQEPTGTLTAQESQIARLAGEGLDDAAIGARLLISARTVEWHLRTVVAKLGLGSRDELRSSP